MQWFTLGNTFIDYMVRYRYYFNFSLLITIVLIVHYSHILYLPIFILVLFSTLLVTWFLLLLWLIRSHLSRIRRNLRTGIKLYNRTLSYHIFQRWNVDAAGILCKISLLQTISFTLHNMRSTPGQRRNW